MSLRLLSYMVQVWMEERRQWTEAKQPQAEWRLTPILLHGEQRVAGSALSDWPLDSPETRFIPTFDTLLLDVKATTLTN